MRLFFYSLKSFISPTPAADGQIESGQSRAYFQEYFQEYSQASFGH